MSDDNALDFNEELLDLDFAPSEEDELDTEFTESINEELTEEVQDDLESEDLVLKLKMNPANFKNFIKIIDLIVKDKSDGNISIISIKESIITLVSSNYTTYFDINKITGDKINLDIINPSVYLRRLKLLLKGDNYIRFFDNTLENSFLITNNNIFIDLPKKDNLLKINEEPIYDFENAELICSLKVDKNTRSSVKELSSGQEKIEYLIKDNLLKVINITGVGKYIFNYQEDKNLTIDNSDIALESASFLPIESEEYNLEIFKIPDDNLGDKYITVAKSVIGGNVDVCTIEECNTLISSDNLLIE